MPYEKAFNTARRLALEFLEGIRERPVNAREVDPEPPVRELPHEGTDVERILAGLASLVARGSVATPGPRYFGFVTGGTLPAAIAADWLVSAWDQNAALHVMSPAMAAI